MKLFAVFQQGVYRHECGGIFSTEEKAKDAATRLAMYDCDSYHRYEVYPFNLDRVTAVEELPAKFTAYIDEPRPIFSINKREATGV
jgi:hypothetical protein